MRERAVLVTLDINSLKRTSTPEEIASELGELSRAAGLEVVDSIISRQKSPLASLLVGIGKAEELRQRVHKQKADVLIFDSDLSSSQQRNLEEIVGVKTIDRTQLILDIFALRARSTEGKLQVELAQLKYLLPRLSGKGIYLSRLGGGVGTRGPGEQKLEVDRRRIRECISKLVAALRNLDKRRVGEIEKKKKKGLPLIAIVGYTNAGKSTLFNALTKASVVTKDQLFSTLDTTTRLLELPGNQKAFLVDTVGFVRELPHHLVESFKATLEEVSRADILLHVVDANRADILVLERAVKKVLLDLGAQKAKTFYLFNKADLLEESARVKIERLAEDQGAILVSAKTGEGLGFLLDKISEGLDEGRSTYEILVPNKDLGLAAFLYKEGEVLSRRDHADGAHFSIKLSQKAEGVFRSKLNRTKND